MDFIVRLLTYILFGLSYNALAENEIHVPEFIKHHIHTKTVFIHVYDEPKEMPLPLPPNDDNHHEDWSAWKYDHYESSEDSGEGNEEIPNEQAEMEKNPGPMIHHYRPFHYAQMGVKEMPNNDIESKPFLKTFEEGYHHGGETETGHLVNNELKKFHSGRHEEGNALEKEFENASHVKTQAGRYLVNEESADDDHGFGYRAGKRISPRMYVLRRN